MPTAGVCDECGFEAEELWDEDGNVFCRYCYDKLLYKFI